MADFEQAELPHVSNGYVSVGYIQTAPPIPFVVRKSMALSILFPSQYSCTMEDLAMKKNFLVLTEYSFFLIIIIFFFP